MYLELGVDASQIQTRFPTDPTQEHHIKTFPSHIYGAITLYGATFQKKNFNLNRKAQAGQKHHISCNLQNRIQFVLNRFRSPLLTISKYFFLLLRLLRCFNSAGSRFYTNQTPKKRCLGSPIRQSWVQKMYAPRPSLSQLTTTLIGNLSQAIPQTV